MLAILSAKAPTDAVATLRALGHTVCALPPSPALPLPVAHHPDMLLFFAPDAIMTTKSYAKVAARELELISQYTGRPLRYTRKECTAGYPGEVLLNAAPVGGRLFCLASATAVEICEHPAYRVVSVRQGYAKCSTLPVGEKALISEDPSILSSAKKEGLDTLQISPGAVQIEGYPHGFLGGAASFAPYGGTDEILFCGDPATHPDAAATYEFCNAHKKKIIPLGKGPLVDVGTIFLL